MICPRCGKENSKGKYCQECGTKLPEEEATVLETNNTEINDGQNTDFESIGTDTTFPDEPPKGSVKPILYGVGLVIAVIAIGIMGSFIFVNAKEKKYYDKLNVAKTYYSDEEFEKAKASYNEAINIEPKKEEGYVGLANSQLQLKETADAVDTLSKASEQTKNDSFAKTAEVVQKEVQENTTEEQTEEQAEVPEIHIEVSDDKQVDVTPTAEGSVAKEEPEPEKETNEEKDAGNDSVTEPFSVSSSKSSPEDIYTKYLQTNYTDKKGMVTLDMQGIPYDDQGLYKLPIPENATGFLGAQSVELDGDEETPELIVFSVIPTSEKKSATTVSSQSYDEYGRVIEPEDVVPAWLKMQVFCLEKDKVKELTCGDYPLDREVYQNTRTEICYWVCQNKGTPYIMSYFQNNGIGEQYEIFHIKDDKVVCEKSILQREGELVDLKKTLQAKKEAISRKTFTPDTNYDSVSAGSTNAAITTTFADEIDMTKFFELKEKDGTEAVYEGVDYWVTQAFDNVVQLEGIRCTSEQDIDPTNPTHSHVLTDHTDFGQILRK